MLLSAIVAGELRSSVPFDGEGKEAYWLQRGSLTLTLTLSLMGGILASEGELGEPCP